ncbi:MAG TPA: FAD-dependent oxidoreductase [Actinomycetota bacterium]
MTDGADAIVVGGGTAGSVVAARLVESGRRVLVLEAGPDYGSFGTLGWPSDLLDASTIPTSHDWGLRSGPEFAGRDLAFERARVIGGCSAHNGCTASWGHRADYDGWAARGLEGWRADDLLPFFHEASVRMRVRRFRDDEIVPFHRAFIDAGAEMGLPHLDDLESLDGVPSVCAQPSNSPEGVRWNAAFAYLDPVRDLPGLEIQGLVRVDRVLFDGHRVVGVSYREDGVIREVWADLVVLAGGTYGSPEVLLHSGVGPAEDLWDLGIPIVADVAGVGRNLHDHPSFELAFEPTDELASRTKAFAASGRPIPDEQGFAKAASSTSTNGVFDLHVFPETAMDGRTAIFAAYLTPRSRGSLSLRSSIPGDAPRIDHAYLSDEDGHDLAALTEGVELARSFASSVAMRPFLGRELAPGPEARTPEALREAIRVGVIHYWHPVGTCAMGSDDDPAAVTDADGRVRGVEGLVVADASLMPATVRATTNLPTVVVGERIAAALV